MTTTATITSKRVKAGVYRVAAADGRAWMVFSYQLDPTVGYGSGTVWQVNGDPNAETYTPDPGFDPAYTKAQALEWLTALVNA
ncbi:hypothetical protein SEA_TYPHA_44 [Mycobacterium phage Typha]|uniref:Uncharacterized protein n=1 Tax=Mycobacterium phage Typha TaxID=2517971 RepID=A0A482JBV4_9CAUD|nr:hypothetical protein KCH40_gp125 [Mycobacterium phage Typha]QBP29699.1 hypothetical protein SEA_TYPHA_44 [Mycobacterium phage Typha]